MKQYEYIYRCPFTEISRGCYTIRSKIKLTKKEVMERYDELDCDIDTNKSDSDFDSSDYTEEKVECE